MFYLSYLGNKFWKLGDVPDTKANATSGSSMAMKDAFGRLAYRIAQHATDNKAHKPFVEQDGLQRVVSVCLANDLREPAAGAAAGGDGAEGAEGTEVEERAARKRRQSVDFNLRAAVSVVWVDTITSAEDHVVYIYEVFQGSERIWHIRKQFLEFSTLDKVQGKGA